MVSRDTDVRDTHTSIEGSADGGRRHFLSGDNVDCPYLFLLVDGLENDIGFVRVDFWHFVIENFEYEFVVYQKFFGV